MKIVIVEVTENQREFNVIKELINGDSSTIKELFFGYISCAYTGHMTCIKTVPLNRYDQDDIEE